MKRKKIRLATLLRKKTCSIFLNLKKLNRYYPQTTGSLICFCLSKIPAIASTDNVISALLMIYFWPGLPVLAHAEEVEISIDWALKLVPPASLAYPHLFSFLFFLHHIICV